MWKFDLIVGLLIFFAIAILVIIIITGKNKIKKFEEEMKKTEAEIIQRKKYEEGVKKDNEDLSQVTSNNKLSNFKSGLDLLRK